MASQVIRIMVVDDCRQRGAALRHVLNDHGYDVIELMTSDEYLPSKVAQLEPDVVLIEIDSPSRDTLEQLSMIHRDRPRPIVLFTMADDEETIRRCVRAGVSAYVVDGLKKSRFKPIIDVAIAHFKEHQSLREELVRTRATLEERKLVDRAKGLVMQRRKCTESEAYEMMRGIAMDQKKRIGQVAEDIIAYSNVFGSTAT